jgi:hypothetical protein
MVVKKSSVVDVSAYKELVPEKRDRDWSDWLKPGGGLDGFVWWAVNRLAWPPMALLASAWMLKTFPQVSVMVLLVSIIPVIGWAVLSWKCWSSERLLVLINLGLIGFGVAVGLPHVLALWV